MLQGRHSERELLERQLEHARCGQIAVLVLRGEPGIGKTALLDHVVERASGCQVVRAAGVQSDMELAFAVSPRRPLVCLIDDLRWMDQVSVQLLQFVARRLLAEPIAMIFAIREPDDGSQLAGLPELVIEGLAGRRCAAVARRGHARADGRARARADPRGGVWQPARSPGCCLAARPPRTSPATDSRLMVLGRRSGVGGRRRGRTARRPALEDRGRGVARRPSRRAGPGQDSGAVPGTLWCGRPSTGRRCPPSAGTCIARSRRGRGAAAAHRGGRVPHPGHRAGRGSATRLRRPVD